MEIVIFILVGVFIGTALGWVIGNSRSTSAIQMERENAQRQYAELEKEYFGYRATAELQLKTAFDTIDEKAQVIDRMNQTNQGLINEIREKHEQLTVVRAEFTAIEKIKLDKENTLNLLNEEITKLKKSLNESNTDLATTKANNTALKERLDTQKVEMEALTVRFNMEFENIANKILESKSQRFTELNKSNLKSILDPLGENINAFKTKVEEVYSRESKERFSLGEKVKELADLNKVISEEAQNLTKALKGNAKTQGLWGEMILETILEKSGLVKGREYFVEHELLDSDGTALKSDLKGKKMRPDAVVYYPGNRRVIIDSKVSLRAFTRMIDATEVDQQKKELGYHIDAIKSHITTLSSKGYDDHNESLDFVMMFIPSEPAYLAAIQGDPELWNFAYERRILLISPTNLIISLKLIVDLWKREYQSQNAIEIAQRGSKLYDKFVGFVSNLKDLGNHLAKAQGKYEEAFNQLSTGNENLVRQAQKLKDLGLKTKKELPTHLVQTSFSDEN